MKLTREEFKELVVVHKELFELWREMQNYIADDCFDRIAYPAFNILRKYLRFEDVGGNDLFWEAHSQDLDTVYDEWLEDEFKDD